MTICYKCRNYLEPAKCAVAISEPASEQMNYVTGNLIKYPTVYMSCADVNFGDCKMFLPKTTFKQRFVNWWKTL